MEILLKPEHQKIIQAQIASGKFTDADAVVDAAFQLLEKLSDEYSQWVEDTRVKVNVAKAELERGEGLDGETVVNQLLERFQQKQVAQE
jgi:antitoxin ParD1/3/4